MQTILGSGGIIANELAKSLTGYTTDIRLVSRTPSKVNKTDTIMHADLLHFDETVKAVENSDIVYLTIGLPYSANVWKVYWPQIIDNVIKACKIHKSKLVFIDNVYMYDKNCLSEMTENTPINPCSKKGIVRAQIAERMIRASEKGEIDLLIARSADFYGHTINRSSVMHQLIFNKLAKNKRASWLGNAECIHSFTYTPDAGKALALLGNSAETFNQIWHIPTSAEQWCGKSWIEETAKLLNRKVKFSQLSENFVKLLGFFVPIMKEVHEMYYQYDRDYYFDSSKFNNKFNYTPVSYADGLKEVLQIDFKAKFN